MNLSDKPIAGAIASATLLLAIAGVAWHWPGARGDSGTTAAPPRQGVGHEVSPPPSPKPADRPPGNAFLSDASMAALRASARTDPDAALRLGRIASMCNLIREVSARGRASRFDDARWRPWVRMCEAQPRGLFLSDMGDWAKPGGGLWDDLSLAETLGDTPEEQGMRDEIALRVMQTGEHPELVAQAAWLYFDRERLRTWAESDLPGSLLRDDVSDFRLDLATLLACRVGTDCAPNSIRAVHECAATAQCYPGVTLEQVVALRRSPQDMRVLRQFVARVLATRD